MIYNQYYPFKIFVPDYDLASLEPQISEYTMFFHYNEHYLPALEKLNAAVLEIPLNQNIPLEQLSKSEDITLRRLAGSVFNHEMHFVSLTDNYKELSEYMKNRIENSFGSMDNFYSAMKSAAGKLYGSGYLWLTENKTGQLVPIITINHETPDFNVFKPIYALDLWEHSYYIDRQNHRDKYVDAAFERINWNEIERNLKDYSFLPH